MPQEILKQIINQLQTLEPSELEQLSQAIQSYLIDRKTAAKRAIFHQALVETGLVRQIKHPTVQQRTRPSLIQIQGESVSQTIIAERR